MQALGWTVVHSLWQILLVWLLFKAAAWRLQRRNNLVYLLSLLAMLVSVFWAGYTFLGEYQRHFPEELIDFDIRPFLQDTRSVPVPTAPSSFSADVLSSLQTWLEDHAEPVGWAWLLCASLLWLRLLGGWWLVRRLKHRGVSTPGQVFTKLCSHWAGRLGIRSRVGLLESAYVTEPLTLGFWKPVVLFPLGLLARLSPDQVEALLLHELAHIRRHDYLVNLFQLVLEVCFFYHPLFWLLSREARARREYCCDDVVLRYTSNPLLYAKTLTDLQLSLIHTPNQFTMNATGITARILRIAGITPQRSLRSNWPTFLLLPLFFLLCSWWSAAQTAPRKEAATPASLSEPQHVTAASRPPAVPEDGLPPRRQDAADGKQIPPPPGPGDEDPAASAEAKAFFTAASAMAGDTALPAPAVVAMEPVKMNVFYIGVDNPLRVAASGVPASELMPRLSGAGTLTGSGGNYIVRVATPGEVWIRVYRVQSGRETLLSEQTYRVKRIPDPTPKLGGQYTSRKITKEVLLQMKGVEAVLENFLFDASCDIVGYEVTVLPKEQDPITFNAQGPDFPENAVNMFEQLTGNGDAIFIDDIQVKCPGDDAPRHIGGLAFKINAAE